MLVLVGEGKKIQHRLAERDGNALKSVDAFLSPCYASVAFRLLRYIVCLRSCSLCFVSPHFTHGLAWLGLSWLGLPWLGSAWLGSAWLGFAGLGLTQLGFASLRLDSIRFVPLRVLC